MKGVVFNLLQQVVTDAYGEDVWDELIDTADVGGSYTSLGSYDDAEIEGLVEAACAKMGLPRNEVLRWFGQKAMPLLASAYPDFFTAHTSARPFVAGVNSIIHAEVRKLYVGAACPHFGIRETDSGGLEMDYRSTRNMCALAQGFVEGAAAYYCEEVVFQHTACVADGADRCRFTIDWMPAQAQAAE
jgi:hypothetical protein